MEETLSTPLRIVHHDVVYEDRNQSIQRVSADFDGFSKEYFVADHGERAALVAVRGGKVLLTRQYRLIINGLSYEIPGGGVEAGEQPSSAAARECLEETGVECHRIRPLISFHSGLDICKNFTSVFWSDNCREVTERTVDSRLWVPLATCIEMVFSQEIVDSLSVASLLAYQVAYTRGPGGLV
jgi:8-oxo-dGTP pyrophosphatase MutT (NUDIX family)